MQGVNLSHCHRFTVADNYFIVSEYTLVQSTPQYHPFQEWQDNGSIGKTAVLGVTYNLRKANFGLDNKRQYWHRLGGGPLAAVLGGRL